MTDINPYLALGINGFCTGLGVIVAQHTYESLIKPRLNKAHNQVKEIIIKRS